MTSPPAARTLIRDYLVGRSACMRPRTDQAADGLLARLKAEVLREAADALDASERLREETDDHMNDVNAAARELRRMAAEAGDDR